ncbi:hypothetical protein F2P56_027179, partial [Juglans regia]
MEGIHNIEEIKGLQREIGEMLEIEDLKWKQRAKLNWYQLGDRNTKFFHNCANQRRRKNAIKVIHDEQNRRLSSPSEMEGVFNRYFQKLFTSSEPSKDEITNCLKNVEPRVSNEMNVNLTRSFTRLEVEDAINQMAPLKSPGPDGFGTCFYQKHWHIVGNEVCKTVLTWLNGNPMDSQVNFTYIALIPKV